MGGISAFAGHVSVYAVRSASRSSEEVHIYGWLVYHEAVLLEST